MEDATIDCEVRLYSIRWWIALLLIVESIILRIIKNSFGLVNDVFVAYFSVTNLAVDWFTLIQIPGMIISSAFLAPTVYHRILTFRKLSLAMSATIAISCLCLLGSYAYPAAYPLIFVGEFLVGFAVVVMDVVSAAFALRWFPEHQIGLALSIKGISGNTGSLLAYLIPSNLLISPPMLNHSIYLANNSDNLYWNYPKSNPKWFFETWKRLTTYASVYSLLAFVVFIFLVAFITNVPPKPPTMAQASLRASQSSADETKLIDIVTNTKEFYRECKTILANTVVLQVALIFSFTQGCNFIQKLFMGEILRKIFIAHGHTDRANVMSGYVLVLFEVGCILGSIVSGKVVDYYKNYHIQVMVDLLLCLISMIGILVGYYFFNIIIIYISNTLFGFFITFLVTPIFECVYQHMYPLDTGFVTLILRVECSVGIIIIGQSCRVLLDLLRGIAVLIYLSLILFLALLISLFLRPNYSRLDAEICLQKKKIECSKTPLLREKR